MRPYSRRDFLKVSASAAGGLVIGFTLPAVALQRPYQAVSQAAEINAWLVIEPDNSVVVRIAKTEMGQGVMTALAMLVAEELEADFDMVRVEYANVSRNLVAPDIYGSMRTANSSSIADSRLMVQLAGAEARERLIKAAAEAWVVSPAECYADFGAVHRRGSSASVMFGEVAGQAAEVSVANVGVKNASEYDLMGLPTPRLDVPAKVDGSAVFSMDVRLPDMVYAAVRHSPVPGGRLRGMRYNAVRKMPGVLKSVQFHDAVAIIAETYWQAKSAIDALPVFWDPGAPETAFSNTIKDDFFATLQGDGEDVLMQEGDIVTLMDSAAKSIESDYYLPYLAQAALEPLNCTVYVQPNRADVWVGHQDPEAVAVAVASVCGISSLNVNVHNCYVGGSFGRRRHTDYVQEAAKIAMEIDRPVQMIWSREEDMRSGRYRPMAALRFKAGFNTSRHLLVVTNHAVVHSRSHDAGESVSGADPASIEGLVDHPYVFPAYQFTHTRKNTFMTSGYFRSGGHSINAYAMECFVDEMANAAEEDPIRFRKRLLAGKADYLRVLDELSQQTGWYNRRLPAGEAMGVAIHRSRGTLCGMVAQVGVENGAARVHKITVVVDSGHVVNPQSAAQQIESSILFGLTATLYGKLTIENGRILEDNLDTYEVVRLKEAPEIEIHWSLARRDEWGGLGEPATPLVAPAVCNALFEITGRRIRSLPVRDYYLQAR